MAIPFDEERHLLGPDDVQPGVAGPAARGQPVPRQPGRLRRHGLGDPQAAAPEDRLTFEDDRPDENGLPGIRIAYELTDVEEADFERARKHQARAAAALGEFVDGMPKVMPAGSSLHYMGTVRMGAPTTAPASATRTRGWASRPLPPATA